MTKENSVFTKLHDEAMAEDKRAILEEMNLPPAMVSFLRKNSKAIKIAVAVLIVGVIAWEGYGEYSHNQKEKAASLLYTAVTAKTDLEKEELLQQVQNEFSGSDSALWARVELGHLLFSEKEYQQAVDVYNEVLSKVPGSSSMYPLLLFSVAQAHDNKGDSSQAEIAYKKLLDYPGFAAEGYLGLGRLSEEKGDSAKALEMYESYINLPGIAPGPIKELVQFKISKLKK